MIVAEASQVTNESLNRTISHIDQAAEVMDRRGVTSIITILVIAFIAYVAWRTYTDWRSFKTKELEDDREYKKQKLKDDMEMSRKATEADFELKRELTKTVGSLSTSVLENSEAIDRTEGKIETHDGHSMDQFKAVNAKLDDLSNKMEIAFDKSNEVETKTMLDEMHKEIKSLGQYLKRTNGGNDE